MKWDLTDIFKTKQDYENTKQNYLRNLDEIESYQGKLCESASNLLNCYRIVEKALEQFEKLYNYGMLNYHLDMANQDGIKLFKEVENLQSVYNTKTAFITPEITYADESKIKEYLQKEPMLKPYERDIQDILDEKKHTLSKESEELIAKYSEVFSAPENTFDILTNTEFVFGTIIDEKGKEVELTDSNYAIFLKSKSQDVRKQAFDRMYKKYSEFINTITELYISSVKKYVITSKLRNYTSSIERAVKYDDSSKKVYETLINTINENIGANYKFLELKKQLLEKNQLSENLHMYDLYVNPFEMKNDNISFEQAKSEVISALSVLGEEYKKLLETAFDNNWIDSNPMLNKRGGAYSSGVYGVHPFVLMSFENSKRDVSTIAHELGHSIHSYYSNENQNVINADYTIMVAEVASTVNELLLAEFQIKNEKNPKKKAELLYELLEMIRATLFRQSMFAEFEKDVHEKIENGEFLSSTDLNKIYYGLNQKYFGKSVEIDEQIQFEWARIPHFYTDFYVYKYATGISAAICIVKNILEKGETYINSYIEMLKQGCLKKSIDLLKMVDVDLESEKTYKDAIDFYRKKAEQLEEII